MVTPPDKLNNPTIRIRLLLKGSISPKIVIENAMIFVRKDLLILIKLLKIENLRNRKKIYVKLLINNLDTLDKYIEKAIFRRSI